MPRSSRYWLLLERADARSPWRVQYGDYSRSVVVEERRDYRDQGKRASNLKIVGLKAATPEAQDEVLLELGGA
jgi:hypothetical protein